MIKTKFYTTEGLCVWIKESPKKLSRREGLKLIEFLNNEYKVTIDRIEVFKVHGR